MPKIAIIILLLELISQIGIINNNYLLDILNNKNFSVDSISLFNINNFSLYNSIIESSVLNSQFSLQNNNIVKNLLLISSMLSLIIGTIVGLSQIKIKRLLAYSTISHIGFILLALAISTEQSIESLIFYIIQYTITNLNTFLIIIALSYIFYNSIIKQKNIILNTNGNYSLINKNISENADINFISEFKGQFFYNPLLSLSLSICLFSMAGIPPLIGFFSKQFVLYSAIQSGYYFMAIIAILVSVISASYYLKIIRILHTEVEENIINNTNNNINNNIFNSKYLR